jgi:hypothetical protein
VIQIEEDLERTYRKLAEIFYRQYIRDLKNGKLDSIDKVNHLFNREVIHEKSK